MKKSNEVVALPFESPEFATAWNEWIEYRKEKKLPKYVPRGLTMTFSKLVRESGNVAAVAVAMIRQSMEQNYQGIFPVKNQQHGNGKGTQPVGKLGTSEARIARAKEW